MAELTEPTVKELNRLLKELARERRRGGGGAGGGAGAGGFAPPTSTGHTAKDIEAAEERLRKYTEAIKEADASFGSLTETIRNDYIRAELELQQATESRRLEILKEIEEQEEANKRMAVWIQGLKDAGSEHAAEQATLEAGTAALENYKKELDELTESADEARRALGAEEGLSEEVARLGQQMLGTGMKSGGLMEKMGNLGKKFGDVAAEGGDMSAALAKGFKSIGVSILLKPIDMMIEATVNLVKAQDAAISNFRKATGAGKEYNLEMTALERQTFMQGVTVTDVGKAYEEMYSSFSAFTELTAAQRMQLGKTATQLEKLGVSMSTQSEIMDQMTRALGKNADQTNDVLLRLAGTAKSIGVPMGKMAQDFKGAFTDLAKYGDGAIDVFEGLAKQAKKTGIEVSALIGIAKQFDTFDGAATSVGKLNAILGGPYLNSIDMLNATEEERIDLLKKSVDASGVQFDAMNRFEKQAIASALGMNVEDAARIMKMSTAEMELQALEQEQLAEQARNTQELMDQLKSSLLGLATDFRPFMEGVITPLVKMLGKFGEWFGSIESGMGRFITVGMMAAGVAAMIMAPFTGGATLAMYVAGAAMLGGIFGAMTTTSGAALKEGTAPAGPAEDLEGFHMGGTVYGLNKRSARAIRMNEGGAGETAIVPVGTYIANAGDTKEMITGMQAMTSRADETNRLLRQLVEGGANGNKKVILQIENGKEFSATVVKNGLTNSDVVTPFGVG